MAWYDVLTGEEFRRWLLEFGPRRRLGQGSRLDPFASSNRNLRRVSEFLQRIEQGEEIEGEDRRREQAPTDLASAGLINRGNEEARLSELGQSVLGEWRQRGIADDEPHHEVPRCLVLYRLALQAGIETYAKMGELWGRLREIASAEALLNAPHFLYAVSYLGQEHEGYNPLDGLLSSVDFLSSDDLAGNIDWDALGASLPENGEDIDEALEGLSDRIEDNWAARPTGRLNFCRAMEANSCRVPEGIDFLREQGLDEETLDICREILAGPAVGTVALNQEERDTWDLLSRRKNVVLYGPPGTGKTYSALRIARQWQAENGSDCVYRITFHPSYDYEDFVEGFRPKEEAPDQYEKQQGVLLNAVDRAKDCLAVCGETEPRRVLILIDEINRGDVARIFGELITYIEPDKRGEPARLAQSPGKSISIPENLFFLGTMNTADKSVSMLDIALRRRFAFVEFPPEPTFYDHPDWVQEIDGLQLGRLLGALNQGLADIGVERDRAIGHSTLAVRADEVNQLQRLCERIEYDVYPLLGEYTYGNRDLLRDVLGDLVDEDGNILDLSRLDDDDVLQRLKALCETRLPTEEPTETAAAGPGPDEAEREEEPQSDDDVAAPAET